MGSTSPDGDLPYWQVNVPPSEREAECPDFLRDLSDKDRGIVGTRDADFRPDSWAVLRRKIETNRLDLLRRVPSVLRLYLAYNRKIARQHGSVMAFVLSQRLRWEPPIVARGRPFEFPEDDVKILWNDWPYGVDDRVVHLVVWTKFPFEEDPITGDLTDAARAEIEEFVVKTFGQNMPRDRVGQCLLCQFLMLESGC
ncbi:uncharacterized protein E0L32_009593 [Thyridium curvatum]|uniref:Uncharacterized protein n=1 Tax=Thyridium curvatum TaxID=1093900 RepID=A0A507AVC1_9PEZI|nr:uncharacterized protein E0L32_009593 [Thyridium curvatum]TPX08889.1 hypothetical protein E0L32_009593 [Thyridium curvatum]